jgi:hypothetical protein
VAEWSNAPDSKSGLAFQANVGSNPTSSATESKLLISRNLFSVKARTKQSLEREATLSNGGCQDRAVGAPWSVTLPLRSTTRLRPAPSSVHVGEDRRLPA